MRCLVALSCGFFYYIYSSASLQSDAAEGYSVPQQREYCIRKTQERGAEVIEEFVDRGASARSANRPEFRENRVEIEDENGAPAVSTTADFTPGGEGLLTDPTQAFLEAVRQRPATPAGQENKTPGKISLTGGSSVAHLAVLLRDSWDLKRWDQVARLRNRS